MTPVHLLVSAACATSTIAGAAGFDVDDAIAILDALDERTPEARYEDAPLVAVIDDLADRAPVGCWADWDALSRLAVEADDLITLELPDGPLSTLLAAVALHLGDDFDRPLFEVYEGQIVLTTLDATASMAVTDVYDVRDLTGVGVGVGVDTGADAGADAGEGAGEGMGTGTGAGAGTGTGEGAGTGAGAGTGTGAGAGTDTGAGTGTGAGVGTDTGAGAGTDTDTGAGAGAGADTGAGTGTDSDTGAPVGDDPVPGVLPASPPLVRWPGLTPAGELIADARPAAPLTPAERLWSVIAEHVDPDAWRDLGGSRGVVHDHDGLLVVTAPATTHRRFRAALVRLRRARPQAVEFDVGIVDLPRSELEKHRRRWSLDSARLAHAMLAARDSTTRWRSAGLVAIGEQWSVVTETGGFELSIDLAPTLEPDTGGLRLRVEVTVGIDDDTRRVATIVAIPFRDGGAVIELAGSSEDDSDDVRLLVIVPKRR